MYPNANKPKRGLPNELLLQIIEDLGTRDLAAVSRTSRDLNVLAMHAKYRNIELKSDASIRLLLEQIVQNSAKGEACESLEIPRSASGPAFFVPSESDSDDNDEDFYNTTPLISDARNKLAARGVYPFLDLKERWDGSRPEVALALLIGFLPGLRRLSLDFPSTNPNATGMEKPPSMIVPQGYFAKLTSLSLHGVEPTFAENFLHVCCPLEHLSITIAPPREGTTENPRESYLRLKDAILEFKDSLRTLHVSHELNGRRCWQRLESGGRWLSPADLVPCHKLEDLTLGVNMVHHWRGGSNSWMYIAAGIVNTPTPPAVKRIMVTNVCYCGVYPFDRGTTPRLRRSIYPRALEEIPFDLDPECSASTPGHMGQNKWLDSANRNMEKMHLVHKFFADANNPQINRHGIEANVRFTYAEVLENYRWSSPDIAQGAPYFKFVPGGCPVTRDGLWIGRDYLAHPAGLNPNANPPAH